MARLMTRSQRCRLGRSCAVGVVLVVLAAACGSSSTRATSKTVPAKAPVGTTVAPTTTVAATTPPTTSAASTVPSTAATTTTSAPSVTAAVTAPSTTVPAAPPIALTSETGVTPAELQRADALIAQTIVGLKQFEYPTEAYAAGYRSIGDVSTGDEHYVNWSYVNAGNILNPMRPQSVVYEVRNGRQVAVAAMYMLPFDSTFANVPDVGGALTQWHVHRNLCLSESPTHKVLAGETADNGVCPPGTNKAGNTPMLHVWIVPNPCGPFAALEGIGAGQVPPGQTRNCDTRNASVP
jgi:hypothetical protein